jgi:hypothetical protein
MGILKDASPRAGIADLYHYIRQKREHNLLLWFISALPICLVLITFQLDAMEKSLPPPPTVTYFESWPADRSLEETMAAIKKRQAEKDKFLEKKRQDYKSIGRALGMDVEAIEKEAEQERAAARKANAQVTPKTPAPQSPAGAAR